MAFTSKVLSRKVVSPGVVMEVHSWDGDSVTTGQITPDSADDEGIGVIKNILMASATDDVSAVRANYDDNLTRGAVTLTFTLSDTGTLTIMGLVA